MVFCPNCFNPLFAQCQLGSCGLFCSFLFTSSAPYLAFWEDRAYTTLFHESHMLLSISYCWSLYTNLASPTDAVILKAIRISNLVQQHLPFGLHAKKTNMNLIQTEIKLAIHKIFNKMEKPLYIRNSGFCSRCYCPESLKYIQVVFFQRSVAYIL